MSDSSDALDPSVTEEATSEEPRPKAAPIDSRFLFVDIAAMRAKQLRRGARPRLDDDDTPVDTNLAQPRKAERVAMDEVMRGLVLYDVPQPAKPGPA
jgi:DNA-directed RNA polymerase subunit K/omega